MNFNLLFEKGKVWTISNLLSMLRLISGFVLYYLIVNRETTGAILLGILAILSDYADGYVARKRNEVSELGKLLDPIADKVAVALGSIALHQAYGLPLWVVGIIIARDVLIIIGSLILFQKLQRMVASEIPGKLAVTVIALLLLSYLFEVTAAQKPLLVLTIAAVVLSFAYYLIRFVKILSHNSTEEEAL